MRQAVCIFFVTTLFGMAGVWVGGTLAWRTIPNPELLDDFDFEERDRTLREMHANVPRRERHLHLGAIGGVSAGLALLIFFRSMRPMSLANETQPPDAGGASRDSSHVMQDSRFERHPLQKRFARLCADTLPMSWKGWVALVGLCLIEYRIIAMLMSYYH